jgi:hypothetical protein
VSCWIELRRGASHADTRKTSRVFLEKHIRCHVDRVGQAAYDVLLNKARWGDSDVGRRAVWKPLIATTATDGNAFMVAGQNVRLRYGFFDEFRCFPMNLEACLTTYPENWWTEPFIRRYQSLFVDQ